MCWSVYKMHLLGRETLLLKKDMENGEVVTIIGKKMNFNTLSKHGVTHCIRDSGCVFKQTPEGMHIVRKNFSWTDFLNETNNC